jgi:hypothetical protein
MAATQRAFDRMVANALKNLGKDLRDGSDTKKGVPDLKDIKDKSDRIDKELEGVKDRLDALAKARKGLKEDIEKAINDLKNRMAREDGKITGRDLEDLKDFIKKLREQLRTAKGKQDDLSGERDKGGDPMKTRAKQEDLEKDLEKLLAKARALLDKKDRDKKGPEFPDAPYRADEKDVKVPPREQDSDEPLPKKKGKDAKDDKDKDKGNKSGEKAKKDDDDDDEPKFLPRLGGPKPKLDPRYKDKQRPLAKKDKKGGDDDKGDLESRQKDNARDLDAAEKSLGSDQNSLENLLDQLKQAMDGKGEKSGDKDGKDGKDGKEGKEGEGKEGKEGKGKGEGKGEGEGLADQLRQLMQSRSMREAMAMAAAARAARNQQPGQPRPQALPMPTQNDEGNLKGGEDAPGSGQSNLNKLDPSTRALIMKLPPSRYREELIRGLNEQGPEAYRAFIQDYFRRLAETRKGK